MAMISALADIDVTAAKGGFVRVAVTHADCSESPQSTKSV